ncbi:MAG: cytochrome c oxidase subunit 4 [Acidobacteria bacterium]|jgi:protein-S-isoprenylcysteine O-methyltransferase Ste14|nr:cytochrome c oxidase subunit 4 [Acidobacteriota bacterium]
MKVEAKMLLALGTFFGIMCAVYWNWSLENAGGVMMFAGMLLCFLPGLYYYWWSRRMPTRPEDNPQATREEGAGVVGAFPGTSIWPFVLGMGAFTIVLSLVFGIWLLVPGLGLAAWAFLGGTSEGRRGGQH